MATLKLSSQPQEHSALIPLYGQFLFGLVQSGGSCAAIVFKTPPYHPALSHIILYHPIFIDVSCTQIRILRYFKWISLTKNLSAVSIGKAESGILCSNFALGALAQHEAQPDFFFLLLLESEKLNKHLYTVHRSSKPCN